MSYERFRDRPVDKVHVLPPLVYACCLGSCSSGEIAQTGRARLDLMALTVNQMLTFRTVNRFQTRHLDAPEGLFDKVQEHCREVGLRLSSVIQFSEIADRLLNPLDSIADAVPDPASTKWTLVTRTGR